MDGELRTVPGLKPKALVAVLLVNRGRVVSSDSIAEAIWEGGGPAEYAPSLQVHVSTFSPHVGIRLGSSPVDQAAAG